MITSPPGPNLNADSRWHKKVRSITVVVKNSRLIAMLVRRPLGPVIYHAHLCFVASKFRAPDGWFLIGGISDPNNATRFAIQFHANPQSPMGANFVEFPVFVP
jgi:hypothetical protein